MRIDSPFRTALCGLVLVCSASFSGCREESKSGAPDTTATSAPAPGLTPLTSRHGGVAPHEDVPGADALPPGHPPLTGDAPAPHSALPSDEGIAGTVEVAPERKAAISGGALFVIARNAKSQQIVAVRREGADRFPLPFQLTAADVMMEGVPFEGPFDVTARWSTTGDAMPGPGDIEGVLRGVAMGSKGVKIVLSEVRR
jgi:cytochrome c-type biogenesis protein CcmH